MIIREFNLDDVFAISEIIDKMGLQTDIDSIVKSVQKSKLESKQDAKAIGKEISVGIAVDIATKLVRNLYKAKKEVKEFIASLTGKTMEEVNKFGLKDMKNFFVELANHEDFGNFLSQVGEVE